MLWIQLWDTCLHLTSKFVFFFFRALNINAKKYIYPNNSIIAQETALFSYSAFTTLLIIFLVHVRSLAFKQQQQCFIKHCSTTKLHWAKRTIKASEINEYGGPQSKLPEAR